MIHYTYYDPYQYRQIPQMNTPCYFTCPVMQNYYRSGQSAYGNCYRNIPAEEFMNDSDGRYPQNPNYKMPNPQVNQVVEMVKKDQMNVFKGIQQFIKDTRLFDYLLAAVVAYIFNNYKKYENVIDEKTDEFVEDLRRNLPWVFDILALFDVTPAMVDKFLDDLIRATVMNIKKLYPAGL